MSPVDPNFPDDPNGPVYVESQYGEAQPASIAIVRAIAVIEDIDPLDSPTALGITLNDHIDPEALDQLVSGTTSSASITVDLRLHNHHQYTVKIHDAGHLVVEKAV